MPTAAEKERARIAAAREAELKERAERELRARQLRQLLGLRRQSKAVTPAVGTGAPSASADSGPGGERDEARKREERARALKELIADRKSAHGGVAGAKDGSKRNENDDDRMAGSSGASGWALTAQGWTLAKITAENDDDDDAEDDDAPRGVDAIPFRQQQSREASACTSASTILEALALARSLRDPMRAGYTAALLGELVALGAGDDGLAMSASCWRLVERALSSRAFGRLSARNSVGVVLAVRAVVRRDTADGTNVTPQAGVAMLTAPAQGNRLSLATSVQVVAAFEGKQSLPDEIHSQGWAGRRAAAGDTLQATVVFSSRFRAVPTVTLARAALPSCATHPQQQQQEQHQCLAEDDVAGVVPEIVAIDRSGFVVAVPRPNHRVHAVTVDWTAKAADGAAPDPHPVVLRRIAFLRAWLSARSGGMSGGRISEGDGIGDASSGGSDGGDHDHDRAEGKAGDGPFLMDLPNETLEHICSFFVEDLSLRAFGRTCTRAHDVCMDGGVWHALCLRQFGVDAAARVSRELRLAHARDAGWARAYGVLRWRSDATTESLTLCRDEGLLRWSGGREQVHASRHITPRELVRLIPW